MHRFTPTCLLALIVTQISTADGQTPPRQAPPATIVTLGDSITKGVRAGVRPEETFAALAERALRADGIDVRGRQPRRRRRADRPGPETARRRVRAPAAGRHRDVRDERQLRRPGHGREPALAGAVQGEPEGDRRGLLLPRHRAGPHDRAAVGRRRPGQRARRESQRPARALHGGVPRGRRRVPRPAGRPFRPLDRGTSEGPASRRLDDRRLPPEPAGPPRAGRGPAARPASTRSGPPRGPSRSRPGSRPCSSTTTAGSCGTTRGRRPSRRRGERLPTVLITLQKHLTTRRTTTPA